MAMLYELSLQTRDGNNQVRGKNSNSNSLKGQVSIGLSVSHSNPQQLQRFLVDTLGTLVPESPS